MEKGLLQNILAEARVLVILAECRSKTCVLQNSRRFEDVPEKVIVVAARRNLGGSIDCPAFGGCVRLKSPRPKSVRGLRELGAEARLRGRSGPQRPSGGVRRRFCLSQLDSGRDVPVSRGRRPRMLRCTRRAPPPRMMHDPTSSGPSGGVEMLWTGKCWRASVLRVFFSVLRSVVVCRRTCARPHTHTWSRDCALASRF